MRTPTVALALIAAALALLFGAGCGTKSTGQAKPETKTTTSGVSVETTKKPVSKHNTKSNKAVKACGQYQSADLTACRDSYRGCAATAKAKVQAYYSDKGPGLDAIAIKYSKGMYGNAEAGFLWQAGMSGCLAALTDEYDRLYR